MKIYKLLILIFFLSFFCVPNVSAYGRTFVFFAESLDGISSKVIDELQYCDKFCFSAGFDTAKFINKNVKNSIISRKIEPVIKITEPYFPLISEEIRLSSSTVLNKTGDLNDFLQNYKNDYRNLFEIKKHGIYLKGAALDDNVLNMFYAHNILWTTAKAQNGNLKGVFFKDGVALFVPYENFPSNITKIKVWLASLDARQKYVPVVLTNAQIKNESFMLKLIEFIESSKSIDVALPVDAAYYLYQTDSKKAFDIAVPGDIPAENKIKLYLANEEVNNCDKKSETYQVLNDELANMYSYDIINGIIDGDNDSARLFDIAYANIFRVLNKKTPNLKEFEETLTEDQIDTVTSSEKTKCEFVKNGNAITINNSGEIFNKFTVRKKESSVVFETDINGDKIDYFDIYIDMNGISFAGEQKAIKPLNAFFVPENSWEYAVRVSRENIGIYKFVSNNVELVKTLPAVNMNNCRFSVESSILRGSPYNWSYQAVAVKDGEVIDFIETDTNKGKLFKTVPLQIKMFKYNN